MDGIESFLERIKSAQPGGSKPLVTLSYAQSLNGSIAARRGAPLAISGSESMQITHRLRAAHDAILVGIGTLLADDPRLNVRLVPGESPQPIVLDGTLRTPTGSRLLQGEKKPWIVTSENADPERYSALKAAGARLLRLPTDQNGCISLDTLLNALGQSGIGSIMVEGGSRVLSAFLDQRLADLAAITIAPRFIGGLNIYAPMESRLHPGLVIDGIGQFGEDVILWGHFPRK